MKIAFLGLGRMGAAMARNLVQAGHDVTVYNRSREKAGGFQQVAGSAAEAARDCEVAITMVADDAALEAIVFGPEGIGQTLPTGAIHVGCSTISTSLARRLSEAGSDYLSAPVFGRPDAAAAKKLLVVAAGPAALIERCHPLFDAIGRATLVAGEHPWQANAVKVCGNLMISSMLETFAETFATLRKSGVDPHLFLEIINLVFASPVYANYGKMMADQQYEPAGFRLRLGLKDVRLAIDAAREVSAPMPLATLVHDRFLQAIAQGDAELDWTAIAKVSARNSGL